MSIAYRKTGLMSLIAGLIIIGLTASAYSDVEDVIKKSFDVGYGGRLTVITPEKVNVEIIRKVDTYSEKEAEEILNNFVIDFRHSGKDVTIEAEYDKERRSFWDDIFRRIKVRYIISVPEKYNVDLKTSGGSISVDDLEGEVLAKTSGGSLHFGDIKGPVTGNTSGGSISLDGCVGNAEVKTSGGSIKIGQVDGNIEARTSGGSIHIESAKGSVVAKTSGGGIDVREVMGTIDASTSGGSVTAHLSKQPQANCELSTSGGSINVYLADDIAVDVDAKTSGGRVITDFPVTVQGELKKSAMIAKINGGGPQLYLRTSGGNIKLNKM